MICTVDKNALIAANSNSTIAVASDQAWSSMAELSRDEIVLIVDDSDDDYDIMQMAMKKCGRPAESLRRCKDGRDALDYLSQRGEYAEPGAAPRPSLILLDLNMPRLDGRETLQIIKSSAELRKIPVVILTNSNSERDVEDCYDRGANSYVQKSLDWKTFAKVIATTVAFWLGAAAMPSQAAAATGPALAPSSSQSILLESDMVHPPRGFTEMCQARPELCPAESVRDDIKVMSDRLASLYGVDALKVDFPELTQERLASLKRVNTTVNTTMAPRQDRGPDSWDLGEAAGDCEDYVLAKRELLERVGWPRSALRIAVVHDGNGYHAVLIAATRQGEFVLDNMVSQLTRVEESPYEFVVAQSVRDAGVWVRVSRS